MGLPWVRLDTTLSTHDKTLAALEMRGGKAAMAVYCFALGWSGGHGTDGWIPRAALPLLHATKTDAAVLAAVGLWDEEPTRGGWTIRNYLRRQELDEIATEKREQAARAGRKSGCKRRGHPSGCTCWKEPPLSIAR